MLDGVEYLFKTGVGLLRVFAPRLLGRDLDEVVPLLQRKPSADAAWQEVVWGTPAAVDKFFRAVDAVSVPASMAVALANLCTLA